MLFVMAGYLYNRCFVTQGIEFHKEFGLTLRNVEFSLLSHTIYEIELSSLI